MIGDTIHYLEFTNSQDMSFLGDESIDLVVSSPPYPMVLMWDGLFSSFNGEIGEALSAGLGDMAFNLMHDELFRVWSECYRVLRFGGIACINVGDATRSLGDIFKLYSNHSRVLESFIELGFSVLPSIVWRKPSNSPNKFMGSGMLPVCAYVTHEHEYILVFRKGVLSREFSGVDKVRRRESAIFWEERNIWFSDLWSLGGIKQHLVASGLRGRSAAYPFELAYRLISMYSIKGDMVLDPFLGVGTTVIAAMLAERNSIGIDIDSSFKGEIEGNVWGLRHFAASYVKKRLKRHIDFISVYKERFGKKMKYRNEVYGFPVVSGQETGLRLNSLKEIRFLSDRTVEVSYDGTDNLAYQSLFDFN